MTQACKNDVFSRFKRTPDFGESKHEAVGNLSERGLIRRNMPYTGTPYLILSRDTTYGSGRLASQYGSLNTVITNLMALPSSSTKGFYTALLPATQFVAL